MECVWSSWLFLSEVDVASRRALHDAGILCRRVGYVAIPRLAMSHI